MTRHPNEFLVSHTFEGFPQKCVFTTVTNLEILDVFVPLKSQN